MTELNGSEKSFVEEKMKLILLALLFLSAMNSFASSVAYDCKWSGDHVYDSQVIGFEVTSLQVRAFLKHPYASVSKMHLVQKVVATLNDRSFGRVVEFWNTNFVFKANDSECRIWTVQEDTSEILSLVVMNSCIGVNPNTQFKVNKISGKAKFTIRDIGGNDIQKFDLNCSNVIP